MKTIFIANTDFEFELNRPQTLDLRVAMEFSPLFMQLQFLPLLFLSEKDAVAVTRLPDPSYLESLENILARPLPELHCLDEDEIKSSFHKVRSWGHSLQVEAWAHRHGLIYEMPQWQCTVDVNSKAYSFENSPKLPGSSLLKNFAEIESWIAKGSKKKVLKSCFGVAARGNFIVDNSLEKNKGQLLSFLEEQWEKGYPVIGEPWVKRVLDFSTQWEITPEKEVNYLGATQMINNKKGQYLETIAGPEKIIFPDNILALEKHKEEAFKLLKMISHEGYFGNIGVDAMLYVSAEDGKTICLHPIVEVNARQTMSFVAMRFQELTHPELCLCLSYVPNKKNNKGLLPFSLSRCNGSLQNFSRQLIFVPK
jgi:hypothetical protein